MPEPTNTITISIIRYKSLIESENKLHALEAAGVDNWEGYSSAFDSQDDDCEDYDEDGD